MSRFPNRRTPLHTKVEWAYHATTKDKLPSIRKEGLVPQEQPEEHDDEKRCTDEAVLFFSCSTDHAGTWGDVMLRFPFPDEAYHDAYGDAIAAPPGYTNWFTYEAVSPYDIWIRVGAAWRPLLWQR